MKKIVKRIFKKILTKKIFKKSSFSKVLQHKLSLNFAKNKPFCAFSLIELSVVILIISFLAVSALSLFSGSVVNTKYQITNTRIQSVYQALENYVSANGTLPCPASLTEIKSTSAAYGQSTSATCSTLTTSGSGVFVSSNLIYGMVPVRALNLNNDMAQDGFGNKLVYVVDKTFTSKTATTNPFSGSTNIATLNVKKYISSSAIEEANAVFAIISHGTNQKGAFPANSSTQITASADSGESDNNPASPDLNITYSSNSSAFDDVVFFKNKANLLLDSKSTSLQSSNLASTSFSAPTVCTLAANYKTGVSGRTISQGSGYLPCDQTGYTGLIGFTCSGTSLTLSSTNSCSCNTAGGYILSSGSCVWQCSISSVAGVANQKVNEGSGTITCSANNFNPSYSLSYTCASGVSTPTINTACTNCASGYNYSVASKTCNATSCPVPATFGTSTATVSSASGTLSCDKTGYYGEPISYTCTGGNFSSLTTCPKICTTTGTVTTITSSGSVIHTFTSVTATLTCADAKTARILVVGGGGPGGSGNDGGGGGGGGGGVVEVRNLSLQAGITYNVVAGVGGTSNSNLINSNCLSLNGKNSRFFNSLSSFDISASGGGIGAKDSSHSNCPGGSSGGATPSGQSALAYQGEVSDLNVGATASIYGTKGGSSISSYTVITGYVFLSGGGGGAGGVGGNASSDLGASSTGGNGGVGIFSDIAGNNYYGPGGGGTPYGLAGGIGAGKASSISSSGIGTAGSGNYGGGGGGGGKLNLGGGKGGDGVVIIRY